MLNVSREMCVWLQFLKKLFMKEREIFWFFYQKHGLRFGKVYAFLKESVFIKTLKNSVFYQNTATFLTI